MRIVISALHFAWQDIEECFDRLGGELGLDGVELSWHRSFTRPHCTVADMAELRRRRDEHGLHLSAHLWENLAGLGPVQAVDAVRFWLDACLETGVDTLVIHGGSWPDQAEGIRRTQEFFQGLLPLVRSAGVTLCLENHYAFAYRNCQELFSEPWEFREVFSAQTPELGFCFDTGHGHMTRNGETLIGELAPFLRYVHLADNHGEHDDHCAYRLGSVPWDAYAAALREIGFDGTYCVEFPVRDDQEPFRSCLADLRRDFPSP